MSDSDLARSHVERCLQDLWGVHHVGKDGDGNYPFASGTALCWIGVDPGKPLVVKAVACAAVDVKKSAKLFTELNDLNAGGRTTRIYWEDGAVLVEQSMLAYTVDRRSLAYAGTSVSKTANKIGELISVMFGGRTPLSHGEPTSPGDYRPR